MVLSFKQETSPISRYNVMVSVGTRGFFLNPYQITGMGLFFKKKCNIPEFPASFIVKAFNKLRNFMVFYYVLQSTLLYINL